MNLLKKAESHTAACLRRVAGVKTAFIALLVCFLASAASAAGEYDALITGIASDIEGIKVSLITIGVAIVAVSAVFLIVRFVRRMVSH